VTKLIHRVYEFIQTPRCVVYISYTWYFSMDVLKIANGW